MARNPVTVFVARAGTREVPGEASEEAMVRTWLRSSLDPVALRYGAEYGLGGRPPRFYTFIHDSHKGLRPGGQVCEYFTSLMDECQREGADLVLVLRQWDGLSSHELTFYRLFRHCLSLSISVKIRVLANDPATLIPRFFEVNLAQACLIMGIELDPDDATVEEDTRLFLTNMATIYSLELERVYGPPPVSHVHVPLDETISVSALFPSNTRYKSLY